MRIDDIVIGDEYTDVRTHYASDVKPRRYRAEKIVSRDEPRGGYRGGVRSVRRVLVVEVDPDTGQDYPEGSTFSRSVDGHSWQERTRTGATMAAGDLEPYGPARAQWEAYHAAYSEVHELAVALRSHLVDPAELPIGQAATITPKVLGPRPSQGRGHEGRIELVLSPETARALLGKLEFADKARTGAWGSPSGG